MQNKIRSLQSYGEAKRRKENRRKNKVAQDRRRQLARSRIVQAVISFFMLLAKWLKGKPDETPEPTHPQAVAQRAAA